MRRPAIISHRGLCRATARSRRRAENTIAGFAAGLDALSVLGFPPSIEFDVRRAADGRLVVIHDPTVNRTTTARGRVSRYTAAELGRLGVPMLTEVFDRFPRTEFHVEVKEAGIVADLRNIILGRRLQSWVIVSSFDWSELPLLRPHVRFALTSGLPSRRMVRTAVEIGACAIHPAQRRTTRVLVEAAHSAGLRVHAWTVNTPRAYRRLQKIGVDAVFSDNPKLLAAR